MLAQAYGYAGYKDRVLPLLDKAARARTYTCPYESAAAYLSIGEQERALALPGEAIEKRSNCLAFLRNDPRWAGIRQDPRSRPAAAPRVAGRGVTRDLQVLTPVLRRPVARVVAALRSSARRRHRAPTRSPAAPGSTAAMPRQRHAALRPSS